MFLSQPTQDLLAPALNSSPEQIFSLSSLCCLSSSTRNYSRSHDPLLFLPRSVHSTRVLFVQRLARQQNYAETTPRNALYSTHFQPFHILACPYVSLRESDMKLRCRAWRNCMKWFKQSYIEIELKNKNRTYCYPSGKYFFNLTCPIGLFDSSS